MLFLFSFGIKISVYFLKIIIKRILCKENPKMLMLIFSLLITITG